MFQNVLHTKESSIREDLLSKLASTKKAEHLKTIIHEILQTPIIDAKEIMVREEEEPNWMTPYKNFLIKGVLPPMRMKFDASNKRPATTSSLMASYSKEG